MNFLKINIVYFIIICFSTWACNSGNQGQNPTINIDSINKAKDFEIAILKERLEKLEITSNNDVQLSTLYDQLKSTVYLVFTSDGTDVSQGSAFCVSSDGIMISNYHVFKNASEAIVINEDDKRYIVTNIIDSNIEKDFIVFKIGPIEEPLNFAKISQRECKVGENVFAVGNPVGLVQTLSTGIISGLRDNGLLQITVPITHGSSGGALFNSNGEVIGVTTSGLGEANLNFALNIHLIENLKLSLSNQEVITNKVLSNDKIESLIKNYYSAAMQENIDVMNSLYCDTLSRFHSLFNITKKVAIDDHKRYLNRFKIIKADIKDLEITHSDLYYVQYKIDYSIIRKSNNFPLNYDLETFVILNKDGKIVSIFDNILRKN